MTAGSRRAHHQVTFAVLALGIGAFALLQSLVVPVLTTVQHQLVHGATTASERREYVAILRMLPDLERNGDLAEQLKEAIRRLPQFAPLSVRSVEEQPAATFSPPPLERASRVPLRCRAPPGTGRARPRRSRIPTGMNTIMM